jgi:hypothetical protein
MDLARAFAGIATMASQAFGGPYFAARLIRYTDPVTDDGGSIIEPATPVYRGCLAQVDVMSEAMRAQQGFAERDVRILILQASMTGGLDSDQSIEILAGPNAGTYSIQSVGADPVAIGWEVRGRPS